jgi:hypothetical protein
MVATELDAVPDEAGGAVEGGAVVGSSAVVGAAAPRGVAGAGVVELVQAVSAAVHTASVTVQDLPDAPS